MEKKRGRLIIFNHPFFFLSALMSERTKKKGIVIKNKKPIQAKPSTINISIPPDTFSIREYAKKINSR